MKQLVLLLCLTASLAVRAQLTARDAFKQMPDSVLPLLSASSRLDMLDYFDAKMKAEVRNELDGRSQLLNMGGDSLLLQLDESHRVTLIVTEAVLPVDSATQVIALCHTYCLSSGEDDRVVQFFTSRWKPLSECPPLSVAAAARLPKSGSTLLRRDEQVLKAKPVEF